MRAKKRVDAAACNNYISKGGHQVIKEMERERAERIGIVQPRKEAALGWFHCDFPVSEGNLQEKWDNLQDHAVTG